MIGGPRRALPVRGKGEAHLKVVVACDRRQPRAASHGSRTTLPTLEAWTERVGGPLRPPATLLRGVIFWSRLHGMISLELDGHLASMQLDAELIYRAELAELAGQT